MANSNTLDQWDPMTQHHSNPNLFNNVPGQSGSGLQTRHGSGTQSNKLYIKNIPKDMIEDGLRNMFTGAVGVAPLAVTIPPPKLDYSKNCGYVTFATSSEATKAIEKLNRQPPLLLEVMYQTPKTDRNPKQRSSPYANTSAAAVPPATQTPPPHPSGVIDWDGVHRAGFNNASREKDRAWADPKDAFCEPSRAGYYNPRGGASGQLELNTPRNTGMGINLNISAGEDGRRVSLGRAFYPPSPGGASETPKKPSRGPTSSLQAVATSFCQGNVSPQRPNGSQQEANSSPRGDNVSPQKAKVAAIKETLPCEACMKPGLYICQLCQVTRYCSETCAGTHWIAHRNTCMHICPPPGVMPAGTIVSAVVAPKPPGQAVQPYVVSSPGLSQRAKETSANNQVSRAAIGESAEIPMGEFTTVTVTEVYKGSYWVTVNSRTARSRELLDSLTDRADQLGNCVPEVGAYVAAKFDQLWNRGRVVRLEPLTVFYVDFGLTDEVLMDDVRELPGDFLRHHAQAVKISLQEGSPAKYRILVTGRELNVKPVGRLRDSIVVQVQDTTAANHVAPVAARPVPLPTAPVSMAPVVHTLAPVAMTPVAARLVPLPTAPVSMAPVVLTPAPVTPTPAPVAMAPVAACPVPLTTAPVSMAPVAPTPAPVSMAPVAPVVPAMVMEDLPAEMWSAVQVVVPGKCSVVVNLVNAAATDMFAELQTGFELLPACGGAAAGDLVAVPHSRAMHRAQVVRIANDAAALNLIDDGKQVIVEKQKLRTLTAEFLALKAQAIKIQLKEGSSQENSDLLEGANISVMPVGKTPEGVWIVEVGGNELPCQQSIQPLATDHATVVFFSSNTQSERYIQTMESLRITVEISNNLNTASAKLKPCQAVEGSFVLVCYEKDWSRAKIISVDIDVKVMYIDYGNEETVKREDLREMPETLKQIPAQSVRVFLSEDTPAAIGQFGDQDKFYATLIGKALDGSLIIRARLNN